MANDAMMDHPEFKKAREDAERQGQIQLGLFDAFTEFAQTQKAPMFLGQLYSAKGHVNINGSRQKVTRINILICVPCEALNGELDG